MIVGGKREQAAMSDMISYSRIESAKFGTRGVFQTLFLFVVTYLLLVLIGSFGPQVFLSQKAITSSVFDEGDDKYSLISNKYDMKALNQAMWAELTFTRPNNMANTEQSGPITVVIDLLGKDVLFDNSVLPSSKTVIGSKTVSRQLTFVNNSVESQSIHLFILNGVYFKNYNLSVTVTDIQTLLTNYSNTGGSSSSGDSSSSSALSATVTMRYLNDRYSIYEAVWKYLFFTGTVLVLFTPKYGYYMKLASVPVEVRSFEQKWILTLLLSLCLFDDPLFGFQVASPYYMNFSVLYILFFGYFLATLLTFWLSMLDNIKRRANENSYGSNGRNGILKSFSSQVFFYLPKLFLSIPTSILCVLALCYFELKISQDMTYDGSGSGSSTVDQRVHELLIASYVFIALYVLYGLYLSLSFLCVISTAKIPYQLLGGCTLIVFIVLFSLLYEGFKSFQQESSLVITSLYGIINMYIWVLAFSFAPMKDDDDDIIIIRPSASSPSSSSNQNNPLLFCIDSGDSSDYHEDDAYVTMNTRANAGIKNQVDRFELATAYI